MLRQTDACQLNPVTHCKSKGHLTPERWCFAVKATVVTITSGLPGGNRNTDGSFNNMSNNGNWWSSTENDATNAWNRNLNYNNSDVNRNNNTKGLGFSARCVRDLTETGSAQCGAFYLILMNLLDPTPATFIEELFQAYFGCRKNKRNTINALAFEKHFERNLFLLSEEIKSGNYTPGRSIAFIVNKPVKREIFAADFRDRVVHHWLIAKLNPLFETVFINDSYACRTGKGTHYGIQRTNGFIKACSENYTRDCYVLKLDVQGFFMHISRSLLFERLQAFICQNYFVPDKELVLEICKKLIFNNPAENCIIKGKRKDWAGLPNNKSLFHSPKDCGLPIGNLTSQVFANFYLNPFDHFIKATLNILYYGRYVDDFIIIHENKDYLKTLIPALSNFLLSTLQLTLHPNKIYLQHYNKGVKFLGVIIKPNRIYISNRTKGNFYEAIIKQNAVVKEKKPDKEAKQAFLCRMNSYLGILKHYNTYKLRKRMIFKHLSCWWWNQVFLSGGIAKFVFKRRVVKRRMTSFRSMASPNSLPLQFKPKT